MEMIDQIMKYEGGELGNQETIDLFQRLIDNGMAWTLQGHYGRLARDLIDIGLCHPAPINVPPEKKVA